MKQYKFERAEKWRHKKDVNIYTEVTISHKIVQNNLNKAIRDGKYLAPPHASAWQHSPH